MAGLNIHDMLVQSERLLARASTMLQSTMDQEYVGTAADDMVTAILANGRITIDLHVLAKRRLEREELGAAIVEAVRDAELKSQEAFTSFLDDDHGMDAFSPRAQALFRETMAKVRAQFPF